MHGARSRMQRVQCMHRLHRQRQDEPAPLPVLRLGRRRWRVPEPEHGGWRRRAAACARARSTLTSAPPRLRSARRRRTRDAHRQPRCPVVIETVDVRSALNLDTGDTVAIAAPSTDIALIAGVAGAIVALLIIAIIVTVVVCMSRRRRTKNAPQSTPPQVAATAMDEFVSAREPASTAVRTHTYGNLPTLYVDSARALSNPPTAHSQYNALDPTEI
jgi:hypothetical protein